MVSDDGDIAHQTDDDVYGAKGYGKYPRNLPTLATIPSVKPR
jgi:hypothetical protein